MPSTYEPIATTTVGSATSTITFSSIPSTYTDLILVFNGASTTNNQNFGLRYNSDSTGSYSYTMVYGDGSSAASIGTASDTQSFVGNTGTANCTTIAQVMNYSNATTYKTALSRTQNGSYVLAYVTTWRNTSAINRIDAISTNTFISGSTFTLYGIKAA
jgi:hypothetical protein